MHNEPLRPDPDRLLEQTTAPHRGKLKIFFGACAGVGKTWAMLAEAQRLRAQGLDVLIGVVETHGRKETAAAGRSQHPAAKATGAPWSSYQRIRSRRGAGPPPGTHFDG